MRYDLRSTTRATDKFVPAYGDMEGADSQRDQLSDFNGSFRESQIRSLLFTNQNSPIPPLNSDLFPLSQGEPITPSKAVRGSGSSGFSQNTSFEMKAVHLGFRAGTSEVVPPASDNADGNTLYNYSRYANTSPNVPYSQGGMQRSQEYPPVSGMQTYVPGYYNHPPGTVIAPSIQPNEQRATSAHNVPMQHFIGAECTVGTSEYPNPLVHTMMTMPTSPDEIGIALSQNTTGDVFVAMVTPQSKKSNKDYVNEQNTLYTKISYRVPFTFSMHSTTDNSKGGQFLPLLESWFIRMSLQYTQPEYMGRQVERCPVHKMKDETGRPLFIMQPDNTLADHDPSTLSVIVPACRILPISFECFSSCAGGIDRKSVQIVFELLDENHSVLKFASMGLKVCANPSRDAPRDMGKNKGDLGASPSPSNSGKTPSGRVSKKGRVSGDGNKRERKMSRAGHSEEDVEGGMRCKKRFELSGELDKQVKDAIKGSWPPAQPGEKPTLRLKATARSDVNVKNEVSSVNGSPARLKMPSLHPELDRASEGTRGRCAVITEGELDVDDDKVYQIQVRGMRKYREVTRFIARLEKEDRYEGRKKRMNPLSELSQLSIDSPIEYWLSLQNINLSQYVHRFTERNLHVMSDILDDNVYRAGFFRDVIGMSKEEAALLDQVFLNWANVYKEERLKNAPIHVDVVDEEEIDVEQTDDDPMGEDDRESMKRSDEDTVKN